MDTYKYLTFMVILGVITLMGSFMATPDTSLTDYYGSSGKDIEADNIRTSTVNLADPDYIYTPQNENTESEGTGGISNPLASQSAFSIFANMKTAITEQQDEARTNRDGDTGFESLIWGAIMIFWTIIGGYGILKLANWVKNRDTT